MWASFVFFKYNQQMTINYQNIEFLTSAAELKQLPPDEGAEVAFAGRSNVGKSSALNALTRKRNLARTSKTPGRTQLINLFELEPDKRLVDLPGYGYAKVSKVIKERWQKTLGQYLETRQCLKGVVLLVDIRHPLKEFDAMMVEWANEAQKPLHILLTKADKLTRNHANKSMMEKKKELKGFSDISIQTFSSVNKSGLDALEAQLNAWLE